MANNPVLKIKKIQNAIVLNQTEAGAFFIGAPKALIISVSSLAFILKFLVQSKTLPHEVLEGILEEYHNE